MTPAEPQEDKRGLEAMSEWDEKRQRISSLLSEKELDALLLQRVSSFAWATGGVASYVNTATTNGASSLLFTPVGHYLIANNIEAVRLAQEEKIGEQGWRFRVAPWYGANTAVAELTRGLRLGVDGPYPGAADLSNDLSRLRARLFPAEGERLRAVGQSCAVAMAGAIEALRPGQTEYEIAALLGREAQGRGLQPIVNLIATDERIFEFRHPLPTAKRLVRYAMLVLSGRREGLVCSITRLVHFGPLPSQIRRRAEATARVEATLIAATRPRRALSEILREAIAAYAENGFPEEWPRHHQGGAVGYEPREYLATPEASDLVSVGQAYAWNPSIAGTKAEDTILVGEVENEELTAIDGWPTLAVTLRDGRTVCRPTILEIT